MIHYYHLLLDLETINAVMRAAGLKKRGDLSHFLVKVVKHYYWFVEQYHYTGPEQDCHYSFISEDLKDARVSLWLPMPREMYRRLKQLHQDLNYYSIAQIVRMLIHMFLGLRENCSLQEVFDLLKAQAEKWAAGVKANRVDVVKLSHMREQSAFLAGKLSPYMIIYDRTARPLKKITY